jgi:hypothetical protein
MLNFFKNLPKYYLILPGLLLVELWSLASFTWPWLNLLGFTAVSVLAITLAIRDLRLALCLIFLELLIGSKGYLFSLELGSFTISIRIALWLIIMSAWFAQFYLRPAVRQVLSERLKLKSTRYFLTLVAACIIAVIIGLASNQLSDLFFDANNWLFLSLALPLATSFRTREDLILLYRSFWLGLVALSLSTIALAYVFSHELGTWPGLIYAWLRSAGLAEITWTPHGFWRIFMQSQLYLVPSLIALQLASLSQDLKSKTGLKLTLSTALILTALFFSLSRSFFLGASIISLIILISTLADKVKLLRYLSFGASSLALSIVLIWSIVASGSTFAALLDRAKIGTEAAASSRWNLLPIIWQEITESPVLGQGFGTTVTYTSADPRILSQSPSGTYTTYAFEWGWLDLWLKLGLWGMLAYLSWLSYLILELFKLKQSHATWLGYSLIALASIHFFTPYLNHPLGLMLVLISAEALSIWQKPKL